jgi:Zn-dependent protease with chaperone function
MQGTFLIIGAMLLLGLARELGPAGVEGLWLQMAREAVLAVLVLLLLQRLPRLRGLLASRRFETAGTLVVSTLYAWWVLGLGLADALPWLTLGILPLLLLLNLVWWLGLRGEEPPRRRAMILQRWRFGLALPLILVVANDFIALVALLPWWERWLGPGGGETAAGALELLMLALLILGLPLLLARLWSARRIQDEQLRPIRRLCERVGLRLGWFWSWPSQGLPFYNALAVGMLGPFRAIFISQDLMEQLDDGQRDAVIGHEIGHLHHNHHLLFILFILTAAVIGDLAGSWLGWLLLPRVPEQLATPLQLGLILAYLGLVLRLAFGLVSRACERQADLVGAELAGSPQSMQRALLTVAQLSGQALDAPSWRHHSIAQRIGFLERVHRDPGLALWHHWYVRMLRLLILILLAFALLLPFGRVLSQPSLSDLREGDPRLAQALDLALEGETSRLYDLVADSDPLSRRQLAVAILRRLTTVEAGSEAVDPRVLRSHINQLKPFLRAGTGDDQLQLMIRNTVAYGLVAGSARPPEDDLGEADALYAELEGAVGLADNAAYRDTLGCIDFRLGRFSRAHEHFARALELLSADSSNAEDLAFRQLLDRRLAASAAEAPDRAHLPLEWSPTDSDASSGPAQPSKEPGDG